MVAGYRDGRLSRQGCTRLGIGVGGLEIYSQPSGRSYHSIRQSRYRTCQMYSESERICGQPLSVRSIVNILLTLYSTLRWYFETGLRCSLNCSVGPLYDVKRYLKSKTKLYLLPSVNSSCNHYRFTICNLLYGQKPRESLCWGM